jgi:hypothetical protein
MQFNGFDLPYIPLPYITMVGFILLAIVFINVAGRLSGGNHIGRWGGFCASFCCYGAVTSMIWFTLQLTDMGDAKALAISAALGVPFLYLLGESA